MRTNNIVFPGAVLTRVGRRLRLAAQIGRAPLYLDVLRVQLDAGTAGVPVSIRVLVGDSRADCPRRIQVIVEESTDVDEPSWVLRPALE